jgi:replicative DNA helicase
VVAEKLPHSLDAEEWVLGSFVIDGKTISNIYNKLKPTDFYSERNRIIYQACLVLYERRETINQITIAQELARSDQLETIGNAAYLSHLASVCGTSLDMESYADIVIRLSISRQLITTGKILSKIGFESYPTVDETIKKSTEEFDKFKTNSTILDSKIISPMQVGEIVLNTIEEYGKHQNCLNWGYFDLDRITTGIYPEFTIVGARPSVGKSQFMLDVADNIDYQGKTILFITSEMTIKQIIERKISKELHLSVLDLRKNGIPEEYQTKVVELAGYVSENNIFYRTGKIYAANIYDEVIKFKKIKKLDIVFVDYLQFLADCWEDSRENQNIRVGRACKILKNIVEDFSIPVIVASQLNRSLEYRNRETKQPLLADLRDSGNIEQDADVVLLLHREELDDYTLDNVLQVKLAKHRQLGAAPHIKLIFDKKLNRYVDLIENYG